MRELRKAFHEGKHEFFDALVLFPKRHPMWIAGTIAGVIGAGLILGAVVEFSSLQSEVKVLRPQIIQSQRGDPCVQLAQANGSNEERIEHLTQRCVGFLNGIAPLVSTKLACAILEKGGYVCRAVPPSSPKTHRGVVNSNGHAPSSQPGPPSGGSPEGSGGGGAPNPSGGSEGSGSPTPSPEPTPTPSLPPQASPKAEPPGLEHANPPGLLGEAVEGVCSVTQPVTGVCLH